MERSQINLIRREIRKRGLNLTYVEDEAVDYLSCQVQELTDEGFSFDEAFVQAFSQAAEEGMFSLKTKLITSQTIYTLDMLTNYLKIAYRNFLRYKVNSAINTFGLVLGLTTSIIIGLYLKREFSYDSMYPEGDRLYRINSISNLGQTSRHITGTSGELIPALKENVPGIEQMTDLAYGLVDKPLHWQEKVFFNYRMMGVSQDFISMFGLKIKEGSAEPVFNGLNGVLLSESMAEKIFSNEDPIGQTFTIDANDKENVFKVDGVFEDLPSNTHFSNDPWRSVEMLISMETLKPINLNTKSWTSVNDPAYVKLEAGVKPQDITLKINELLKQQAGDNLFYTHYLQPVRDIHLNQEGFDIESEGNLDQLYLFGMIGILILVIACINYINLTTAQASVRLKEVGVRKVIGATKKQFIVQFLIEATLMSVISIVLAMLLVSVLLPLLNSNFSLQLNLSLADDYIGVFSFLGIMLLVSLLCGTYPGFYLSRLRANELLKTSGSVKAGGGLFRKVLVVLQYATSITLIIATLIITDQLNFLSKKDLGFNKEQVVYVDIGYQLTLKYGEPLFTEFAKQSGVIAASLTSNSPGDGSLSSNGLVVGDGKREGREMHQVMSVDWDFKDVLGLQMKQGRWFSEEFPTDRAGGFVVNEAFVEHFGLDEPIGVKISRNNQNGVVVGVVKDFHFKSMHESIEPLILFMSPRDKFGYWNMAVRLSTQSTTQTLDQLGKVWGSIVPDYPFKYEFLDAKIDKYYKSDRYFGMMFSAFSGLAILVSCLGLIGLVAFTTQRRAKEIGVRKVLGATVLKILKLLSMDFVKLILLGALLAIPIAYYFMDRWLQNFEYRIEISYWSFVVALMATVVVSWLSVSYLSLRAAKSNPVDSLRTE
jgi:putative ABC transport system permease protein